MKKNKIIKGVVLSTMLFSTVALPVYTTVANASTITSNQSTKQVESKVDKVSVNFKDVMGNKMGSIEKTNLFIGKSFKLKDLNSPFWKVSKGDLTGTVKKGGTNVDLTIESTKEYDLNVNYIDTETGALIGNSVEKVKHGAIYDIDVADVVGYTLDTDLDNLKNKKFYGDIEYEDGYIEQGNLSLDIYFSKNSEKEFINPNIDFKLKKYAFDTDMGDGEREYIVDVVAEKYGYQYKDNFDLINSEQFTRNLTYSDDYFYNYFDNDIRSEDTLNTSYYINPVKDFKYFDEKFGQDFTGIKQGTKVVNVQEILDYHGLKGFENNETEIYLDLTNEQDSLYKFSSIENADYLTSVFVTSVASLNHNDSLAKYLDEEITDDNFVVYHDSKVNLKGNNLDKNYPRYKEDFKEKMVGKRVSSFRGETQIASTQFLEGFSEFFEKDNELYIRTYYFSQNPQFFQRYDYTPSLKSALTMRLDSEITVNYVSESGRLLDTTKEIIDKNTNYSIENKEFEDYKLKNENDKDKKVYVNKDMSVNIVYTPLKEEPTEPAKPVEKGTLVTKYVDEDGNDIAESTKEDLLVGQEFKAVAKEIKGYTLKGENEILGEMVKDGKTVIFEYLKDKEEPVKPVEPTKPTKPVDPKEPTEPVENLKEIDKALKTNIQEVNKSRGIILGVISMILATCLGAFATTFKKEKKEVKKDK